MTTLPKLHPQAVPRSTSTPSKPTSTSRNPFARPKLVTQSGSSFSRTALLPPISSLSPAKQTKLPENNSDSLPLTTHGLTTPGTVIASTTTTKSRSGWRLLWRGGLEIGREGWRVDGITFFALLSFPPPNTPTASQMATPNPFDVPIQSNTSTATPTSPFPSLESADADLCLSLESMRGRKYLQIRGMTPLPEDEVLEGEAESDIGSGVRMAISDQAPLIAAYFTGLLCRSEKLSAKGRTLNAIIIGLGDESIDPTSSSSILVYGQRHETELESSPGILRLCVARRKPPPAPPDARKVRPGEPLPRAPLFFPAKAPKKPPPLFPNRSLSRTTSISSSIYHPPIIASTTSAQAQTGLVAAGRSRSPDRRGEKRPRKSDLEDEERLRKTGRIVTSADGNMRSGSALPSVIEGEDIFGNRGASVPGPSNHGSSSLRKTPTNDIDGHSRDIYDTTSGAKVETEQPDVNVSTSRGKRRVPQQVFDNKAAIRKQTLVLLDARGISRTHELFNDVFGMTTKGTYFAFRDHLENGQLSKVDIQRIITSHLDMYISVTIEPTEKEVVSDPASPLKSLKGEDESRVEVKMEAYQEVKLEGTLMDDDGERCWERDEKVRLQVVAEEEEEEVDDDDNDEIKDGL